MVGSDHDFGHEIDSADEALCEMLGLKSLALPCEAMGYEEEGADDVGTQSSLEGLLLRHDRTFFDDVFERAKLRQTYFAQSVCTLPSELSVPAYLMRRLTDELVWGGPGVSADRSFETIQALDRSGKIVERRVLTRLENFVNQHPGWSLLCHQYLKQCISELLGEPMVLFKEKLNLKPAGGSGFAPHLDTPSLRIALGESGPQNFVTVMVAIDDMTQENGCLRVARGPWTEASAIPTVPPDVDGNPDAGGRAGALVDVEDRLEYECIKCRGGDIVVFNGWVPHRSGANQSPFARRAVFLTYNQASEGNYHDFYYEKMNSMRRDWRARIERSLVLDTDEISERQALATVPKI